MLIIKLLSPIAVAALALTALAAPANAATSAGQKHLTASLTSDDHVVVDWLAATGAKYYKVKTASTPDMKQDVKTYKVAKSHTAFTFDAATKHYAYASPASGNYVFVRVYAVKSNSTVGKSPYKRIRLNPLPVNPAAQRLTVATFNVRTAEQDAPGHSWASRVKAVGDRIRESGASVVAIEEAGDHGNSYKTVITIGADGSKHKSRDYNWQFEQLRDAVGGPYALANDQEYSSGAGKEGTRILYDTSKLTMLAQGDFAPSAVNKYLRFIPWAQFQSKSTGEKFYFVAAHLDNRHDEYKLRVKQIGTVIDRVREFSRSGEQVVLAGDLNSNIYSSPNNAVDRKLLSAGFRDAYATAVNVNEFHETFSNYHRSKVSASRTDYIMTFGRPDLGAASYYKNWTSKSDGIYPSDHNLQSAVVPF